MSEERLVEAPGVLFLCGGGCTEDKLLTSVAGGGVSVGVIAGGLATETLFLSLSER